MTDEEIDVIIKRAMQNADDNGYRDEMAGWTTYEYAVDLADKDADLNEVDVFVIEAGVKRFFGFEYDESDAP